MTYASVYIYFSAPTGSWLTSVDITRDLERAGLINPEIIQRRHVTACRMSYYDDQR